MVGAIILYLDKLKTWGREKVTFERLLMRSLVQLGVVTGFLEGLSVGYICC